MRLILLLQILIGFLLSPSALAAEGIGPMLQNEIEATFLEDGRVSPAKIERFKLNLRSAEAEIHKSLVDYYINVGNKSPEEAERKASSTSIAKAYDRLQAITSSLSQSSGADVYRWGAAALHLGYSVRSEGRWMDYEEIAGYAKGVFKRYQVKRRNKDQSEASNLWSPSESRFYSQSELMELKSRGVDVSTLNPLGDGSYWTNVNIPSEKMQNTFQKASPLYRNSKFVFPSDGATVQFDEVKRSQSRPKFDVTWNVDGKKKKLKLKFLSETNSEVTAATLLAALGFNTDPSQRIRNVTVRFKDGEKPLFHRDLESYYSFWEMQNAVVADGRDEKGDYIILREALLEARSEDLVRVGAWSYTRNGHPETREVRALPVFMAWIANNDMKESGQNKAVFEQDSELQKMFFVSGDLGWSFGSFLMPETVSWFKWNIIKDVREDSVSFNYLTWLYSDLFQFTTWDDARWMIRLIAQLSREQIRAAVIAGQWDPKVENVLVEKLVARRNQLVKVFELDREFPQLNVNDSVAPADPSAEMDWQVNGGLAGGNAPGSHQRLLDIVQSMSRPVFDYLGPSLMRIHTGLINAALDKAVKPVTEIRISGDDLAGLGLPFAAGVILRLHRSIVRNEEPRSMDERFLVHDQVVIGWTLGTEIASVGSSITYYRSFNLVYPVRKQSEGVFKAAYLPALLMPYSPGQFRLPNKHSLLIEDYVEGRGSIGVSGQSTVDLNAEASLSRVYLKRTLVSDRADGKVDILLDNSHYTDLSAKVAAVLRVAFVEIDFPFFDGTLRKGSIDRELWSLPANNPESKVRARTALQLVTTAMRTDYLPQLASRKQIDADYVMRKWGFNLFSLVTSLDTRTTADVDELDSNSGAGVVKSFQIENVSESLWRYPIFDVMERDTVKSFYLGIKNEEGGFDDTVVGLNIRSWDSATTSQELRQDYVQLAQKSAADANFIVFTPELHTNKDQWGAVVTMVDVLLYQSAIDVLFAVSEEKWWSEFTRLTKIVPQRGRDATTSATEAALVAGFKNFLAQLENARRARDARSKAKFLTQALGNTAVTASLTSGIKGDLIGVVLSQLPEDSYFLSAKITSPLYKQNIFPQEKPLVNRRGTLKYRDARLHDFSLNTISVIYNFFDSVIPEGGIVPSVEYPF
ncbi:MAG: hypothetical protein ACO3A4_01125 [Silvanigrellaceae bacterium]